MSKPELVDMGPVGQSCFTCGLRGAKKDKCAKFKRKIKLTQWCDEWIKWVKEVPPEPEKKPDKRFDEQSENKSDEEKVTKE